MLPIAILAALAMIGLAALLLVWSRSLSVQSGLPTGRVVYDDAGREAGQIAARPLYSARYGLSGKPDYLVQTRQGLVPVEVKPGRTETEPMGNHILQVLAYCLLLEDTRGEKPPYGLLRYKNDTFKVDYNSDTRDHLLSVIEAMRTARHGEAHRNHDQPGRCRACAYREVCDESLWAG